MADLYAQLTQSGVIRDAIATLLLLAILLSLRGLLARSVESSDLPAVRRRRLLVQTRNAAGLLFFTGGAIIWAQQLQTVALSLAAIGVALVIATKELILCLSGALMRVSSQAFSLGDRIEVNGLRGDVIDIGALTTTLLEIGPGPAIHKGTGRTIVVPNALFLTHPITNETFTDAFVLHATTVPMRRDEPWQLAEQALLEAAWSECQEYLDDARTNMERVGRKHGLEPPSVEPRVWVRIADPNTLELVLRYPAPARARGMVEQAILRRYLERRPPADGQVPALTHTPSSESHPGTQRVPSSMSGPSSVSGTIPG